MPTAAHSAAKAPDIPHLVVPRPELHQLAHQARLMDLRDFDWMSLDYDSAMAIHTLLPAEYPEL